MSYQKQFNNLFRKKAMSVVFSFMIFEAVIRILKTSTVTDCAIGKRL